MLCNRKAGEGAKDMIGDWVLGVSSRFKAKKEYKQTRQLQILMDVRCSWRQREGEIRSRRSYFWPTISASQQSTLWIVVSTVNHILNMAALQMRAARHAHKQNLDERLLEQRVRQHTHIGVSGTFGDRCDGPMFCSLFLGQLGRLT